MCGICGRLDFKKEVKASNISSMTQSLFHRGPDEEGIYVEGRIGLGCRRLSIIDLKGGHQPLSNEDKNIWAVFNGEIYNFKEVKVYLEKQGHVFKTRCDTEVIVHSYEEWGTNFVIHLNGMFAIALWDSRQKKLVLVRDRVGIKPLYYAISEDGITFGSELKAVLNDPMVQVDLDSKAVHYFFALNYIPAPLTIYKQVKKLNPGEMLICDRDHVSTKCYWDLPRESEEENSLGFYSKKTYEGLLESVGLRLMSDVPMGIFLSGGVDSSIICALYSQITQQKIKTFSVGFKESSYNELDKARLVAERFNTDHYELIITPKIDDILPKLVRCFDEPFADSSAIPLYYVSTLASEYVKVVLTGDGADEIFGGYETYVANNLINLYKKIPPFVRKGIIAKLSYALPVCHSKISLDYKIKRFIAGAELSPIHAHAFWRTIFSLEEQSKMFSASFQRNISETNYFEDYEDHFTLGKEFDFLNRYMYVDVKLYLPNDMLVKVDRVTMANSIEARVPFLDHNLIEMAFKMPSKYKINYFSKKYILKKAFSGILCKKLLFQKKQGFNVPIPMWINNELKELIRDNLFSKKMMESGIFERHFLRKIVDEHAKRIFNHSHKIWGLLMFSLWFDNYKQLKSQNL
ncbi:MAG: asparagine synthase (glutamine-hydrolyzing) [Candidatus Scalinduaceae bacterium]